MKKRIGIPVYKLGPNSYGVTNPYIEFIRLFGTPIFLYPDAPVDKKLDLLILPGGPDVDTYRYGQYPGPYTQSPSTTLEYFDKTRLGDYIAQKTPIFGICRGLQTLVVHFGGELIQHLHYHKTNHEDDRDSMAHEIYPIEQNIKTLPFAPQVYKKDDKKKKIEVNSLHHQAAEVDKLPAGLKADYYSIGWVCGKGIALAEAIRHEELPITAVQWHPKSLGLN